MDKAVNFCAPSKGYSSDLTLVQDHGLPGMSARELLEGCSLSCLNPWLMPDNW